MESSSRESARTRGLAAALSYACVWLPAAVLALYMKWWMLNRLGYEVVARILGYDGSASLSWLERLSLYRDDLLIGFVLIPALILLLVRVLPYRLRLPAVTTFTLATVLFLFVNLLTYSNVGRFVSPGLARDAMQWTLMNPHYLGWYVSVSALTKLGTIIALVAGLAWLARRLNRHGPTAFAPGRPTFTVLAVAPAAVLLLVAALHLAAPPAGFAASVLRQTTISIWGLDRGTRVDVLTSPEDLWEKYRELANLPDYQRSERYFGAAADHDILFFVFETAPSRILDVTDDELADLPNLRRLRRGSLIAANHHSTYPYTSAALFSLFSGWYPSGITENLPTRTPLALAPMSRLGQRGYATAVYAPSQSQFTSDEQMFAALGFTHYTVATVERTESEKLAWQRVTALDRAALARMKADLATWLKQDHRYAAAFLPQAGHAPWPDIGGIGDDPHARGRAILAYQDVWLGELLDLLEAHGRLDRTIIVVTSDHGVRTRKEYPALPSGKIDDASFRVPLLIYAPGVFGGGQTIRAVTSHVDVAPTLLDLLGVAGDPTHFQGMPLWDERKTQRRTFLLAHSYLGADGFHDADGFYMHNEFLRVDYSGALLRFSREHLLKPDAPRAAQGREQLAAFRALQRRWLQVMTELSAAAHGDGAGTTAADAERLPAMR